MLCRSTRAHHITTTGLGKHHTSPKKVRADKHKAARNVIPLGHGHKHRYLLVKLDQLGGKYSTMNPHPTLPTENPNDWEDVPETLDVNEALQPRASPEPIQKPAIKQSAKSSLQLYANWAAILPGLVHPLLNYISTSMGSVMSPVSDIYSTCVLPCTSSSSTILCLYFDRA
jgi:hypothetical protein